MKTQSLLLSLLLVVCLLFHGVSPAGVVHRKLTPVGVWKSIKDVKAAHVQEIGQFSVAEHNKKAKTDLKYESVVKGQIQVGSGTNYRLVIIAKKQGLANNYEAVVWEKLWNAYRNLTSFKPL